MLFDKLEIERMRAEATLKHVEKQKTTFASFDTLVNNKIVETLATNPKATYFNIATTWLHSSDYTNVATSLSDLINHINEIPGYYAKIDDAWNTRYLMILFGLSDEEKQQQRMSR